MTARALLSTVSCLSALLVGGCATAQPAEKEAKDQVSQIGRQLKLAESTPRLPPLSPDASLADFARYAVLNHPSVRASYQEWRGAVEAIAPNRALPDPKLTFEADIQDTLMTFMPGLMFDFMTPGKRAAMAHEATASSRIAYRAYVSTVLRVASEVRQSWIDLAFIEASLRLREAALTALAQSATVAEADYATGRGMGTLESQVRFANETSRVHSEIAALNDRLAAARAGFKSTLGLLPADPDPAWPHPAQVATTLPPEEELWRRIQSANADLAQMRAMVDMAVANVDVARTAGTPDFAIGAMADLKAEPLMVRPTASVTLPVWRGKIAALVAAAEARRDAAVARLNSEQLTMAAQLAQMLYMVRESDRMIAYIDDAALPNYERAIASVEAGYQSGMTGLAMIPETKLMAVAMRLERAKALKDRETAVTGLLLMISDIAPEGSPLLSEQPAAQP